MVGPLVPPGPLYHVWKIIGRALAEIRCRIDILCKLGILKLFYANVEKDFVSYLAVGSFGKGHVTGKRLIGFE